MHCVISWDIPTTPNRDTYQNQLIECFSKYLHSKPLTTFYIVKIPSQSEYSTMVTNLQNIGKTIGSGFKLVISPVMTGGRYDGLLNTTFWTTINQICE